ncbi:MAG: hypothetical protein AB7O57_07150 [Hyphomicrobiaceae bacterium]
MLNRRALGMAAIVLAALAIGTVLRPSAPVPVAEPVAQARATSSRPFTATQSTQVAEGSSCASECQDQHDRCRVQRKGSPSCDEDRQRCLQGCLQKKRK